MNAIRRVTGHVLRKHIPEILHDKSGSTAIEYALIASGISIAIVVAVNGVGSQVGAMFTTVAGMF